MAFWGVEVEPGKPFTLKATEATRIRRLHLSHATLGGIGNETARHILVCNVGNRRPLYLCILSPGKVDSCQLNLDFEEADEVIFSVIGPLSIHITGYFLPIPTAFRLNDDVQVLGRSELSDYPLPVFYERLYKLVDDPSSDSIISWSKKSKSFVIRNQKKFIRRKIHSRFPFSSTFEKFISMLKYYGFSEMKSSDGLLEFGNENFVRGQPMLMKEMHQKAMMKRINKDLTVFKAQRR